VRAAGRGRQSVSAELYAVYWLRRVSGLGQGSWPCQPLDTLCPVCTAPAAPCPSTAAVWHAPQQPQRTPSAAGPWATATLDHSSESPGRPRQKETLNEIISLTSESKTGTSSRWVSLGRLQQLIGVQEAEASCLSCRTYTLGYGPLGPFLAACVSCASCDALQPRPLSFQSGACRAVGCFRA
jgi:hypothetical protein